MTTENTHHGMPSYWNAVITAGLITGTILTVIQLTTSYMTIAGSSATGMAIIGCLIASIAGIISNWMYAKGYDLTYPIGKGALLGVFSGIITSIVTFSLQLFWTKVIDTGMNEAIIEATLKSFEDQGLSQEEIDMAQSFIPDPNSLVGLIITFLSALAMYVVINLISGIISAKIFAKEEE
tara:strand:- start:1 stop:540 length:540 start_codon:yes stop_codon:yes gene_type:complete